MREHKRNIGILTVVVVAVAIAAPSRGAAEEAARKQVLTAPAVIAAFRARNSVESLKRAQMDSAKRRSEAASSVVQAPPSIGMELESQSPFGRSGDEAQDAPPPRQLTGTAKVGLSQELTLGVDGLRATTQAVSLAEAELLEKSAELAEDEIEMIEVYLGLRREGLIHTELQALRPRLERLVAQSREAARLGTLGALTATEADLLLDQVMSDLEQARLAYEALASTLSASTGLIVPPELGAVETESIPDGLLHGGSNDIATNMRLKALEKKQQALAAERDETASRRTMEIGFGASQSWGKERETGVFAEVKLPLGVGAAARSEARALDAERDGVAAEGELLKAKLVRELAKREAEVKRLSGAARRTADRANRLGQLLEKKEAAFRRGQGEVSEVLATLSEVLEARIEAIRTRTELEAAGVARHYLVSPAGI